MPGFSWTAEEAWDEAQRENVGRTSGDSMMLPGSSDGDPAGGSDRRPDFPTTQWTLVARNGNGILATVEIDTLKVATPPPETRVLTTEVAPADLSLVDLGGFSFPFSVRNEGNAPAHARSQVAPSGARVVEDVGRL